MKGLRGASHAEVSGFVLVALFTVILGVQVIRVFGQNATVDEIVADLQSFALHQTSYHRDRGIYGSDVATLEERGFVKNPAVHFAVHEATRIGWSVTARHERTAVRCYLFVGDASPVGTASQSGVVACE